jgi:hypothetical protein
MKFDTDRRGALFGLGAGLMLSGLTQNAAQAATGPTLEPAGATNLQQLSRTLAGMPRRRDFKSRPMIADNPEVWDAAPLNAVLAYKGGAKQAWDNTDLTGPWLNGMRNSLNSQIWGFKEPNFLCVSATHGAAHLALYDHSLSRRRRRRVIRRISNRWKGRSRRRTTASWSCSGEVSYSWPATMPFGNSPSVFPPLIKIPTICRSTRLRPSCLIASFLMSC